MATRDQMKKYLSDNISEVVDGLDVALEILEENPAIEDNLSKLVSKYLTCFVPMVKDVVAEVVDSKLEAIKAVENKGFSRAEAITIVCGR